MAPEEDWFFAGQSPFVRVRQFVEKVLTIDALIRVYCCLFVSKTETGVWRMCPRQLWNVVTFRRLFSVSPRLRVLYRFPPPEALFGRTGRTVVPNQCLQGFRAC